MLINRIILAQEKIIVLQKFDSLIDANIVKTKLDAYDVPCFLTEEHVTHLTTPILSGGIRLHIFARDKARAEHVLIKDYLAKTDDAGIIQCPKCHSKKIFINRNERDYTKLNEVVFRLIMRLTRRYYCLDCGNEFDD